MENIFTFLKFLCSACIYCIFGSLQITGLFFIMNLGWNMTNLLMQGFSSSSLAPFFSNGGLTSDA